jgi:hypothetical protein
MIAIKAANRMRALELRIAKLEAASQPVDLMCPQCHAFGLRVENDVARGISGGKRLHIITCRFCPFSEEKWEAISGLSI